MAELISPGNQCVIDTHTQLQNDFVEIINEQGIAHALAWLLPQKCEEEFSRPMEIRFEWTDDGSDRYRFEIAENEAFDSAVSFVTELCSCRYTNLKIGRQYYWRVNGCQAFSFRTADNKYRFVEIDGALNVRDVGGINIKQGMLYRGSEINKEYILSQSGKDMMKRLGIKTELNLRKEADYGSNISVAGDDVQYVALPYRPYLEVFEEEHRRGIVAIMEFLADETNYPIYFHCLGGADRTGMIALYLRALLGERDEDIFVDYELTSLSTYALGLDEGVPALGFRSRQADYFTEFLTGLDAYSGDSLSEKVERFLLDCHVNPKTICKIREILRN